MFALGLPAIRVGWHVYPSPFGTGTGPWGLHRRPGKDTSLRVQALGWGGPVTSPPGHFSKWWDPCPTHPDTAGLPLGLQLQVLHSGARIWWWRETSGRCFTPGASLLCRTGLLGQARTGSSFTPPTLRIQVGVSKASFPATRQLLRQSHPVCLSVHVHFLGI